MLCSCIDNFFLSVPSFLNCKPHFTPNKPRLKDKSKDIQTEKPAKSSNEQKLSIDEIEQELENVKDSMQEENEQGFKPLEAKTLNVHNDKELCLKRLSSSWNNLNESKKDFGPSDHSRTSELTNDTRQVTDSSKSITKKKKISDYFQPASKS